MRDRASYEGGTVSQVDAYQAATLLWWLANTYGVCHDVSVLQPTPRPARAVQGELHLTTTGGAR